MKLKDFVLAVALLVMGTATLPAQTVALLHNFTSSPDGATPFAGLLFAGGTLYGTTEKGGSNNVGTVFAVNTDGPGFKVLHNFSDVPDGSHPLAGLVLSGNTLYGATVDGGTNGYGSLFSLNTNGSGYAVLYSFNVSSNGVFPNARLLLWGGTLYGTAAGEGYGSPGWGTVFSFIIYGNNFIPIHNFTTPHGTPLTNTDGEQPESGLVRASSDTLYGTAYGGGTNGYGTVYSLDTKGNDFTVLHTFTNNPDGAYPQGGLVVSDDMLYGTTETGGTNGKGTVFAIKIDGTGYLVLHNFATNGLDGINPWAALTVARGTLYGTTRLGGSFGKGTVFSISTNGTDYAVLYNFTNSPDGAAPESDLVFSGGVLYGTTEQGGSSSWGTVFSLSFAPQLTIIPYGENAILAWPTNYAGYDYTGFTLQSTTNLVSPAVWNTNLPSAVVVNGQNVVTNPITGTQRYFRLSQ